MFSPKVRVNDIKFFEKMLCYMLQSTCEEVNCKPEDLQTWGKIISLSNWVAVREQH